MQNYPHCQNICGIKSEGDMRVLKWIIGIIVLLVFLGSGGLFVIISLGLIGLAIASVFCDDY